MCQMSFVCHNQRSQSTEGLPVNVALTLLVLLTLMYPVQIVDHAVDSIDSVMLLLSCLCCR